jgi:hypothetical protein
MQHIQGIQCDELQLSGLEDKSASENPIRFIETYVKNADFIFMQTDA